jgi:alkylhydroperoxidase family enzyme
MGQQETHPMTAIALSSEHGTLPLAPIDRPKSWLVRRLFGLIAKRYGVVPTAFRVVYARSTFLALLSVIIGIGLLKALRVSRELAALIQISFATRNGCTFCADLHIAEAVIEQLGSARFRSLLEFESSDAYTPREKAALRYVKALHESLHIPDEVWTDLRAHFDERECVDIVWLCAIESYYNNMAIPLRIGSDQLAARAHPGA